MTAKRKLKPAATCFFFNAVAAGLVILSGCVDTGERTEVNTETDEGVEENIYVKGAHFSPDGAHVAFFSNRDGNDELYIADADGTQVQRVTYTEESADRWPRWAPDGTALSFMAYRNNEWDLFTIHPDGSEEHQLTDYTGLDLYPDWSPDGQAMVFSRVIDESNQLFIMQSDGRNKRQITNTSDWAFVGPRYAPEGDRLIVTGFNAGSADVYVMDTKGQHRERLTDNGHDNLGASWSPDGQHIAYLSNRGGENPVICVMTLADREETCLPPEVAPDSGPTWTPDGNKIVFHMGPENQEAVFVMDVDGTTITPLISNQSFRE